MNLDAYRLTPNEWNARSDRINQGLRGGQLDALVVYGTGQHHMLLPDYLLYCSGFLGVGQHSVLLLVPGEQPELFVSDKADLELAQAVSWMVAARLAVDIPATLAERIRSRKLARIGLVGRDWMPDSFWQACSAAIEPQSILVPSDDLLGKMAWIKSAEEIARVEKAASIADAGFAALVAAARPGVTDYELDAEVDYVCKCLGASDNFGMIAAAAHNRAGHPPVGHRLETGDIIVAEITPCYGGYFAQLCRSIVIGELKPHQQHDIALQQQALADTLAVTRPGQPASVVARTMNALMDAAGYAEYSHPPHMRSRGHGMGLGSTSPGELTEDTEVILEDGMTFIVHPNQYFPQTGYLVLGDMVELTSGTIRVLTQTPPQIFTV